MPALSLDPKGNRWRLRARQATAWWKAEQASSVPIGSTAIGGTCRRRMGCRSCQSRSRGIVRSGSSRGSISLRRSTILSSALIFVFASAPHWRSTIWALGPNGTVDLGTSRLELDCRLCRSTGAARVRSSTPAARGSSRGRRDARHDGGCGATGSVLRGRRAGGPVDHRLASVQPYRRASRAGRCDSRCRRERRAGAPARGVRSGSCRRLVPGAGDVDHPHRPDWAGHGDVDHSGSIRSTQPEASRTDHFIPVQR